MQGIEGNKTIEQKIDKNKDYITDEVEIKNFLLEDENQSQNIQELGNYLNNLQDKEYNEIKQNLEYIMTDPEIVEMFDGIRTKVGKNEKLTDDELSILYIFAVLYGKSDGFTNEGKFDLSLPIEKICNGKLLFYIQRKYLNLNYKPNYKDEGNNLTHTYKKSKNEADTWIMNKEGIDEGIKKIEREYKGLPQIPSIDNKGFIRQYCDKILKRADENGYLMKAEHESRLRNEFRTYVKYNYDEKSGNIDVERVYNKEFEAYVQYEKLLYAFTKYCEVINNKHEELVKKAGFFDMKEFSEEVKFLEDSQELLKDKYPGLESAMERLKSYFEEIEENKKRYFSGKTDEEIEEAQKDFTKFKEFEAKKAKEDGITSETIKSISTQPESEIEVENYFKNLFKFWKYQNELNEEELKYGDNIENCQGYIEGIKIIEDKNKQSDFEMINKYMNDLNTSTYLYRPKGQEVGTSKGRLNIMDKFNKYSELLSNDPILKKALHNISIINKVLRDPTCDDFWITDVKNEAMTKKLRQESINNRWNNLYENYPGIYEYFNEGAAIRNSFINFTIGTGTSLGAMICGIIRGKEHYQSALQRKQRRDSALSFGISTEQQEPIYDPETHSIKLNRKNGPYQVASSITNMFLLINGGGEIASKIGGKFASQIGLFGMSFIQQAGQSFGEAINSGLDVGGAFAYSMLSASVQSGLELISPNEILLGKGIGLGKQLVTSLCKDGNKEGIKLAGKYFLKTMFHEIAEENLQEGLQLAAGNLINGMVNGIRNTGLESDRNPKNFLSTAIITTLTTGITTGFTAGKQGLNIANSSNQQLLQWIKSDGELYEDVMKVLNNTINGNMKIPNIDIENLKLLRGRLEGITASQETTNQNNEEEQRDNQKENQENREERIDNNTNSKKEQIIESMGSTLHEEWRQSRLKSDGTYEPRIKTTTDQERINRNNGETQVDIANTSFENLPADRKYENLEAAKVAVNLVYDILSEGQEITPEMIETLSSIVHEEWLKRNGRAKGGELDVPYSQLSEEEKAKDRRQIQQAIETVNQNITQSQETEEGQNKKKKRNKDYFNGQPHEFNVENMQEITIENSQYMDNALENVVNETDKKKLQELINDIKNHIEKQYEQVTGEKLNLTDDQVWSILDAHSENGSLGKLKIPELYKKVRPLIETIADKNVRRFLLEFGFCGQEKINEKTNVELLEELGIKIPEHWHEEYNNKKFNFEKIKYIQSLGVTINKYNLIFISELECEDIGYLNFQKFCEMGILIRNPLILNEKINFQQIQNLLDFGIEIDENNIKKFNRIKFDFAKLESLKENLKNFGITINSNNIIELSKTRFDFRKLNEIKLEFKIDIDENNIIQINEIDGRGFEALQKFKKWGVHINSYNIAELSNIDADNPEIKKIFDEFGFIINFGINERNNIKLTDNEKSILRKAHDESKKNGIIINSQNELNILLDIASNTFSNKKDYIERKNKFLEENETLSVEKFNELFKDGEDKGKYGIGNIYQTDLGFCYAYTGFELLKKSNFFETLVRTSMKETDNGREVKLPLGDSNGHTIKINKSEINSKYSFIAVNPDSERELGKEYNVNINSNSILGLKILEIAFIKEYLINQPQRLNEIEIARKAKNEYNATGDITINGELLHRLEGGWTSDFMEHLLGNTINTCRTNLTEIIPIFGYINSGNIKIMLDSSTNKGGPKTVDCTLKNGNTKKIRTNHAYSIERTYIDRETKEKIIVIVNPRDSSEKLEMTLNECLNVFNIADITTINIDKKFK